MSAFEIPTGVLLMLPTGYAWLDVVEFTGPDAYNEADREARRRGLTTGSMQYPAPTACFRGADYVSKWRGLSIRERLKADAIILTDGRTDTRRCWLVLSTREVGHV